GTMRSILSRYTVEPARVCFFFQAEDGIRDGHVTGVQTCALPISRQEPEPAKPIAVSEIVEAAVAAVRPEAERRGVTVAVERPPRSEERRVGKECRCRGWPDQ